MEFVEVESKGGLVLPKAAKAGGGSYFDDELQTRQAHSEEFWVEMNRLVDHVAQRPDHEIFVGSIKDRTQMREVLNHWRRKGMINHNPKSRIDYGVPEGTIRVGDGR